MKKILVISDLHIPTRANSEILEKLDFKKYDYIICAGDIVEENTYYQLINQEADFIGVQGNMDDYYIKEKLPMNKTIEIEKINIGLIHGHQTGMAKPELLIKKFSENINIMIFGHSHKVYDKILNKTRVINPGSLCDGYFAEIVIDNNEFKINFEKIEI